MKNKEWALLDRQALGVIQLMLSHNVTFNIAKKTTMGLMATLFDMYEKSFASNKLQLMRLLFNLWMIESVFIATHINEFSTITTQLSLVEIKFDNEVRALIFVSSYQKVGTQWWQQWAILLRRRRWYLRMFKI